MSMCKIQDYQQSFFLQLKNKPIFNLPLQRTPDEQNQFLIKQNKICCVCGMSNCEEEAFDHNKVFLEDLNSFILQNCQYQQLITKLKFKIKDLYKHIRKVMITQINKQEKQVQKYLNKFCFDENVNKKIDLELVSNIIEKDIRKLPNKGIKQLVNRLNHNKINIQSQYYPSEDFSSQVHKINEFVNTFLQNFQSETFISGFKSTLSSINIREMYECREPKLTPKTSVSDLSNPEQSQIFDLNKVYEWRNVRVTRNSKIVGFSNKNMSDREVMQQIVILSNFKNLQQFQIRNNKISSLSCNLIANNMPFLLSVDIRSNKIDDKGIIKLINGIPLLKSFFISQTQATDQSGIEIANKLPQLQMLWAEYTRFTNEVAFKISNKPKLKVLSLLGNPIDEECKQKMKKIYISKGYLSI